MSKQEVLYQVVIGTVFLSTLLLTIVSLWAGYLFPAIISAAICGFNYCIGVDFIQEKIKEGK